MWGRPETRLVIVRRPAHRLPGVILNEIMHRDLLWVDALAIIALILAGWPIARSGWNSLRYSREININVLMTIAAVGAVIIGATVEAAMVMVLFAIGEALEGYTTGRARQPSRDIDADRAAAATRLSRPPAARFKASPCWRTLM